MDREQKLAAIFDGEMGFDDHLEKKSIPRK
jgi:hypothetical protein